MGIQARSSSTCWNVDPGLCFLIFLCAVFSCRVAQAQRPVAFESFDFDAAFDSWTKCQQDFSKVGGVQITSKQFPPSPTNLTMRWTLQTDGRYGVSTTHILPSEGGLFPEDQIKSLMNPGYAATIRKKPDGNWYVDTVAIYTEPQYEELTKPIRNWAWGTLFDFVPVQKLRNCSERSAIDLDSIDGAQRFELTFKNVDEKIKTVKITVSRENGFFPEFVHIEYPETTRTKEFSKWIQFEGYPLWQTEAAAIPEGSPGAGSRNVYEREFDAVPRIPDQQECYLDFYGLPEPIVPTRFSKKLTVGIAVGILAMGLFLYWRHSQRS